jgi:DNA-binding response OmpR family regulator
MLPTLNGYEVCQKIRREQDDNDTPIIMLTAKKGDADRIVGGVVGAQRYLTKPFDAEFLLGEIKALLGLPPA